MRKIEQNMLAAVKANQDFRMDNTEVKVLGNIVAIFLHGNQIATIAKNKVIITYSTLFNWPTKTTISRLRALGVDIKVKKGAIYYNGEKIN